MLNAKFETQRKGRGMKSLLFGALDTEPLDLSLPA